MSWGLFYLPCETYFWRQVRSACSQWWSQWTMCWRLRWRLRSRCGWCTPSRYGRLSSSCRSEAGTGVNREALPSVYRCQGQSGQLHGPRGQSSRATSQSPPTPYPPVCSSPATQMTSSLLRKLDLRRSKVSRVIQKCAKSSLQPSTESGWLSWAGSGSSCCRRNSRSFSSG